MQRGLVLALIATVAKVDGAPGPSRSRRFGVTARATRPTFALAAIALGATLVASRPALADARVYEAPAEKPIGLRSLDLYGWVQPRFAWQQTDVRPEAGIDLEPNPAFTVRRARIGAIAWVTPWLKSQVELELAGTPALVDAYVVASPRPEIALTMGQFRVPFSRQNRLASRTFQLPDTAYFVAPKYLVDRDIGAMVSGELFGKRASYFLGAFNGNDPGANQLDNNDPYLLFAARLEAAPFGPAPRFEGDLRPLAERVDPKLTIGAGWMHNRLEDKHFNRTYLGADLAAYWQGASLYAELYARRDTATDPNVKTCSAGGLGWVFSDDSKTPVAGQTTETCVTAIGWNVQAGYFPPVEFARDHVELVARVQRFDPNREVKQPALGERDLAGTNSTWGYLGYVFGVNLFAEGTHDAKLQTSYEVRNETKRCLQGQDGSSGHPCTGYVRNNLFLVQLTAAF